MKIVENVWKFTNYIDKLIIACYENEIVGRPFGYH